MPEPIKVTREQWDAACARYWDGHPELQRGEVEAEFAAVLGCSRPGPDTPPFLRDSDGTALAWAKGSDVYIRTDKPGHCALLLPWLEDHLLPWLREQVKEVRDVG